MQLPNWTVPHPDPGGMSLIRASPHNPEAIEAHGHVQPIRRPEVFRRQLELYDDGIEDALDISSVPAEILATLGYLGRSSTADLHQYIRDNILTLLSLLETGSKVEEVANDAVAVEVITVFDNSVELIPKAKNPARLIPKVEEGAIKMATELEMGHDTGPRVLYSEFQQVHAIL